MTYGASRLDLLLIERLILYLLAKWSGSMSAKNICSYICNLTIFLDQFLNSRFECESSDTYCTHKSRCTHR